MFRSYILIPDIILIDSSRFMHLPIINLCYEVTKTNPNTIIIMEIRSANGRKDLLSENKTTPDPFQIFSTIGQKIRNC